MSGKWIQLGRDWALQAKDGTIHARVQYQEQQWHHDRRGCWVMWTAHTEGNDRFKELAPAKAYAEKRLKDRWEQMKGLFE